MSRFGSIAAFALLVTPFSWSQSTSSPVPFRGAVFSSSVAELHAASAAVAVTPEHKVQILLEESRFQFAADGTRKTEHRRIFRIDAQEAVQGWAEISNNWDPWFEKPSQLRARVLTPDGRFVELDQKTVTDAPVKGQDDETYSSEHVRRAPIPAVTVGAIVETVETTEEKTPYFAPGGNYRFWVQLDVPVAVSRLILEVPQGKDLRVKLPEGVALTPQEESLAGGGRRLVYEAVKPPTMHDGDIDLSTNEASGAVVQFSTGASWEAMAAGYAAMAEPQIVVEEAKGMLPASLPTERAARIAAIVAELHKQVRYTGVEFGEARLTPQKPSETMKRHYGDCKDKAALLVSMLRAAGVPAHLALLDTGAGNDVDEEQPGLTRFDHAIVYVPASGKDAALWIDATAEFYKPGMLPWGDRGRKALVIAPGTKALLKTPEAEAAESVLVETRSFKLAPYGPATTAVELSETSGDIDARYRSRYRGEDSGDLHVELEKYANSHYLAKKLVKVTHGDAADLGHPFALKLEMEKAGRGSTSLVDGGAAMWVTYGPNRLPKWFGQEAPVLKPEASAEVKREFELAQASRGKSYVFMPFVDERHYRVEAPDGFTARALPANKTTQVGKATLTETYSSPSANVIEAVVRFDSGPGTLTAEEALTMRTAVLELEKREYVGLFFDAPGEKEKAAGHVREALAAEREMVAKHPEDAMYRVRLAHVLSEIGLNDEARLQARKAVELDPKLAIAHTVLAYALEENSMGERFSSGMDYEGALAELKQAVAADPENKDIQFDLAVLYEFNPHGYRYAKGAHLEEAIAAYRAILKDDTEHRQQTSQNNLLYALYFAGRYKELQDELAKLPANSTRRALAIAAATIEKGTAAGLAEAQQGNEGTTERQANLRTAGTALSERGRYAEAAEMMRAGVNGEANASQLGRQIELFSSLKATEVETTKSSDPTYPAEHMMRVLFRGEATPEVYRELTSHDGYTSEKEFELDLAKGMMGADMMRVLAKSAGMQPQVMRDLVLGQSVMKATGDDATGWRVTWQLGGSDPDHFFVAREGAGYKVVCQDKDVVFCGNAILKRLERGDTKGAKNMLDWSREQMHRGGGDDPFSGPLLPRFWTVDSTKPGADSPEAMKLAAMAMVASSVDAKPYLKEIAAAREKATGARVQDLDLLLAEAASGAEDAGVLRPVAERLLEAEPDSEYALFLLCRSYELANEGPALVKLMDARLAKKPGEIKLMRRKVYALEAAGQWEDAHKLQGELLTNDKAEGNDFNGFAWQGVTMGKVGDAELKAGQETVQRSKSSSFSQLHTLACVYAMLGRVSEARNTLEQAMTAANQTAPNSEVWFALGLIYEQYGDRDAALKAYAQVVPNQFSMATYVGPSATYRIAQNRIAVLKAEKL